MSPGNQAAPVKAPLGGKGQNLQNAFIRFNVEGLRLLLSISL